MHRQFAAENQLSLPLEAVPQNILRIDLSRLRVGLGDHDETVGQTGVALAGPQRTLGVARIAGGLAAKYRYRLQCYTHRGVVIFVVMFVRLEIKSPGLRALAVGASAALAFPEHRIPTAFPAQHDGRRVIVLRRRFVARTVARLVIGTLLLLLVKSGSFLGVLRLGEATLGAALHEYTLKYRSNSSLQSNLSRYTCVQR